MKLSNGDIALVKVWKSWDGQSHIKTIKMAELIINIEGKNMYFFVRVYPDKLHWGRCISPDLKTFIQKHIEPYISFIHSCTPADHEKILPASNNHETINTLAKLL